MSGLRGTRAIEPLDFVLGCVIGIVMAALLGCGDVSGPSPCPDPSGRNPQQQRVTREAADTNFVTAYWYDTRGNLCREFDYGFWLQPTRYPS
jgi:hypothetical protein